MPRSAYDPQAVEETVLQILRDEIDPDAVSLLEETADDSFESAFVAPGAPAAVRVEVMRGEAGQETIGAPGHNDWSEEGWIMVHAGIGLQDPMSKAQGAIGAVAEILIGRRVFLGDVEDGRLQIHFRGLGAEEKVQGGQGMNRGVSRSVTYRYEFTGP